MYTVHCIKKTQGADEFNCQTREQAEIIYGRKMITRKYMFIFIFFNEEGDLQNG